MGFLCSYLKTTAAVDLPTHYLYLRTPLGLAPNILLPTRTTITSGVLEEGVERDHHTYTPLLVPHHTLLLPTIAAVAAYATIVTLPNYTRPATHSSLSPTRRAGGDTLSLTVDSLLIATY